MAFRTLYRGLLYAGKLFAGGLFVEGVGAAVATPPNVLDFDVVASPGPFALDMTASRTVSEDLTVSRALDFDES